ncbi:hypothetical protein [Larkinella soli]|uniref:hypothetical protein n=1 Tax=Larkinella soli TaxID=1770527 RepID=UPI000FFC1F93|nr:hypothetical protein [Larkinella soli]
MTTDITMPWQTPSYDLLRPLAEALSFSCLQREQSSFNAQVVLFRGSAEADHFILVTPTREDRLEVLIYRYDKRLCPQPTSEGPDSLKRQCLFYGKVHSHDEAGMKAILEGTVEQ